MKRFLIFVVVVAATAVGACDIETDSGDGDGIDPGLGSQDASGDVELGRCETEFGAITCELTITNSSDGRSDYYIEAAIENAAGEHVGTANAFITGVEGGQTARDELFGAFTGGGRDLSVRLTTVQRTAS